ncbi:hypothetical protein BH09PAT3_BH09PAT3_4340 [soil metagenome]
MVNNMKKTMTPSWDLVKPSALLVREHFVDFMYIVLLPGLLYLLGSILLTGALQDTSNNVKLVFGTRELIGLIVIAIAGIWSLINLGPMTYFELRAAAAKPETISDYYRHGLRYTLPLVGLYILMALAIIGGLILFIIPGLFMIRRYLLAPYYLVDRKLSIFAALRKSAEESKPVKKAIWGIIGVQVIVTFAAGALQIIPVIGIVLSQLVTYAITFILVLRYQEVQATLPKTKK